MGQLIGRMQEGIDEELILTAMTEATHKPFMGWCGSGLQARLEMRLCNNGSQNTAKIWKRMLLNGASGPSRPAASPIPASAGPCVSAVGAVVVLPKVDLKKWRQMMKSCYHTNRFGIVSCTCRVTWIAVILCTNLSSRMEPHSGAQNQHRLLSSYREAKTITRHLETPFVFIILLAVITSPVFPYLDSSTTSADINHSRWYDIFNRNACPHCNPSSHSDLLQVSLRIIFDMCLVCMTVNTSRRSQRFGPKAPGI